MITAFHKLCDVLDKVCGVICVVCLAAMVVITGAQIACRLFFTALPWSEEATRYLMVWATFLGASCVYKRMGHISVTVLHDLLPKAKGLLTVATHVLCCTFFIVAAYQGYEYMDMQAFQKSAALRIPMSWAYLAIPIGCALMALNAVDLLLKMLPGGNKEEAAA